jgi:hypothetical protein
MKYEVVESKLKTNKTRNYLWNKINTPQKIIKIEEFDKHSKVRKLSENNYELISKEYHVLITFIPKKGTNLVFIGKRNFPMTWFEISGEENCTIVHGEHKRMDSGMNKTNLKLEIEWLKNHFLEELKEIAK